MHLQERKDDNFLLSERNSVLPHGCSSPNCVLLHKQCFLMALLYTLHCLANSITFVNMLYHLRPKPLPDTAFFQPTTAAGVFKCISYVLSHQGQRKKCKRAERRSKSTAQRALMKSIRIATDDEHRERFHLH